MNDFTASNVSALTIAGVDITTDAEGRFSLNALHKASGQGEEKAPAKWIRNKQAQEFLDEVEKQTGQICLARMFHKPVGRPRNR